MSEQRQWYLLLRKEIYYKLKGFKENLPLMRIEILKQKKKQKREKERQ